jgi:hypothetical protein
MEFLNAQVVVKDADTGRVRNPKALTEDLA